MRIIDFHGHCGIQHNTHYEIEEICEYLNKSPVAKIVISSLSSIFSHEEAEKDLLELSRYPLFVPTYWVNPYIRNWQVQFQKLSDRIYIKGIKLHPTANIYKPTLEMLKPVFELCRKNKLFITLHTDTFNSSPTYLSELLLEYPDVNVVLIHMDDPINSIFLAKQFKNVFLETSWIERKWRNLAPLKIALDSVDNTKIFFGSDFPYEFPITGHEKEVGTIRNYEAIVDDYSELLSENIASQLLFGNARNFLMRYGINVDD
jgi:predicted TIM-barrel fold metal-dependent hydrolase